ncbi:MAG: hypothetical protein Q7S18_02450, partial [bacterium]|nr:hypothetical protein [bacterium]
ITAAILFLILVVPLIFIRIKDTRNTKTVAEQPQEKVPSIRKVFPQEKNIIFVNALEKIFKAQDIQRLAILNEKLFIIGKNTISIQEPGQSAKKISFPQNFGTITEASSMKDLNLILIATDQRKIISFIPTSSQFAENKIQIPENSKIAGMGTYLTYLYLLDSQNSQIYRYPRSTGGFGEKANWLKDSLDLSSSRGMDIDENIYLSSGDKILKLFKGKSQDFNLEATVNPFTPDEIFTDSETANLYVLDSQNGRVIKYSKDGTILNQYFSEGIKNTTGITVDEKNNKVYLLNSDGVSSFDLQ